MKDIELGTDIQLIEDFKKVNRNFLEKIFTEREIAYCSKKKNKAQHLAARFAGKEAVIKALYCFGEKLFYKDIEILINNKKPEVRIVEALKSYR